MNETELRDRIQTLELYAASPMTDEESREYFLARLNELRVKLQKTVSR